MKTFKFTSDGAGARRAHTSVIIGKHLLIHGGINSRGVYLNDLVHLDLATLKWSDSDVSEHHFFNKGIAFHKCCSVYNPDKKLLLLYRKADESEITDKYKGWVDTISILNDR